MAFDLKSAAKNAVKSATIDTVTSKINSKIPGVSSQMMSSALKGGDIKGAIGGALGGALGGGSDGLIGAIKGKLDGLAANSPELRGLTNTALKLVEKGAADLKGLGGEYGLKMDQYRELADRTGISGNFVDSGFLPSYKVDDSAASKVPNPLRSYNGVNYIITLGVLSAEEYNNPDTYRGVGSFKNYIIQSAGGNLNKRYQVFDEHEGNVKGNHHIDAKETHAEYYIDDIELDSVVAPNENTRMTLGTSLTFNITEPYSMGNFIQAIRGAAFDAGYANYAHALYM